MFGMGIGELGIIAAIVFLFLGPKKLPQLAKGVGEGIRELQLALKGQTSKTNETKNDERTT